MHTPRTSERLPLSPRLGDDQQYDWAWEPGFADILEDPIVRLLMQSDGVSEQDLRDQRRST